MPRLDGTGPWGAGPMTGWGRGLCGSGGGAGYARGGRGLGFRRGPGGRYGRGFEWGGALPRQGGTYAPAYGMPYPHEGDPVREMDALRSEAEALKARMEEISRRMREMEKPPTE